MAEELAKGRAAVYVDGCRYALTRHARRRCAEMGFDDNYIETVLREGRMRQHTKKSAHWKEGKGWICQHGGVALGLVREGPEKFTVITMLWRDLDSWQVWFDQAPETDRQRRPTPVTTMETVDDI